MIIDNNSLGDFRDDFNAAVKELEKKYEITIKMGQISYNASSFRFNVGVENQKNDYEGRKATFLKNADIIRRKYRYDFRKEHFMRTFRIDNKRQYVLVGLKTKSPKYMCEIEDMNGKKMLCPPEMLKIEKIEY